ncbi:nuclear transport factor 2 family protein [Sphingomonas sp. TF3]|jgi:hypothetical protein|nr:nuclear transport factor 2 family protein [Sphingomonas sp. TF3]
MTAMNDLEWMSASFACERLCNAFSWHLDQRNFEALADLFTHDGVFVRNDEHLSGRAAILDAYAKRPDVTTVHFVNNFQLIALDSLSARGTVYNMVLHSPGEPVKAVRTFDPLSAIRVVWFQDDFAMVDGSWRFAYRHAHAVLQSPTWPGLS